jgi:hypothetical protein
MVFMVKRIFILFINLIYNFNSFKWSFFVFLMFIVHNLTSSEISTFSKAYFCPINTCYSILLYKEIL